MPTFQIAGLVTSGMLDGLAKNNPWFTARSTSHAVSVSASAELLVSLYSDQNKIPVYICLIAQPSTISECVEES
jgi:hypothetical protein